MSPHPVDPLLLNTLVSSGELHTAGPASDSGLGGGSYIPHPHSTKGLRSLGDHSCSEPEPAIATSRWRLQCQRKSVPEGLWLISSNNVAIRHQEEVACDHGIRENVFIFCHRRRDEGGRGGRGGRHREREQSEGDQQRILLAQKVVVVGLFLWTVLEMTWNCSTDTGKTG